MFNFREILFEKEVKNETEDYADAPWCPTYEVEEIYKHQLTLKNKQEVRGIEFNLTRFVYIYQLFVYTSLNSCLFTFSYSFKVCLRPSINDITPFLEIFLPLPPPPCHPFY